MKRELKIGRQGLTITSFHYFPEMVVGESNHISFLAPVSLSFSGTGRNAKISAVISIQHFAIHKF
jgi:hypothetical protein